MKPMKVNLLAGGRQAKSKPATGHQPVKFVLAIIWLAAIFGISFGVGRLSLSETASAALASLNNLPIIKQMHLIGSPDRQITGEPDDRINVLVLGMGGEGHDGPLLTDTIMVASIRPSDRKVALLSIPRDLVVPLPGAGWRKINAANAFGELEVPGRGADFSRTALEGLLGLDIPYYVRLDFRGFEKIVDDVGGIDVYVDRSFTDSSYPTDHYGYQVVAFKKGWQHMSGADALEYVRSRHGNNGEGSDFARAARQQKVLAALKDKLFSFSTLRNPAKISNLLAELQSDISTNLQVGEILRLAKMGQGIDPADVIHKVIDDSPGSPLVASVLNGAFVLVPRNDDWGKLRDIAADIFNADSAVAGIQPAPPPPPQEKTRVEIQNGTGQPGLAREAAAKLANFGFVVVKIGNAESFSYRRTTIYDLTGGRKVDALAELKKAFSPDPVEVSNYPLPPSGGTEASPDFLVILGKDLTDISAGSDDGSRG